MSKQGNDSDENSIGDNGAIEIIKSLKISLNCNG
jgi:hypothetical protein